MDDLELQMEHKKKSNTNKHPAVESRPQSQNKQSARVTHVPPAPATPTSGVQASVEAVDAEAEKPKGTSPAMLVGAGLLVVIVGYFAYTFLVEDDAPVVVNDVTPPSSNQPVTPKNNKAAEEKQRREEELAAKRLEEEDKKRQQQVDQERKRREEREFQLAQQQQQAEAQRKAQEEQARLQELNTERNRLQNAGRKLSQQLKTLEAETTKAQTDLLKQNADIIKNRSILAEAAERAEKRTAGATAAIEKAKREATAAKNQIAYAEKKTDEVNKQIQNYQKSGTRDVVAQLQQRLEGHRKEVTSLQAALAKAETDQASAQTELNANDPEVPKAKNALKDLATKREATIMLLKTKLNALAQLKTDPDYTELSKLGGDITIKTLIESGTAAVNQPDPHLAPIATNSDPAVKTPSPSHTDIKSDPNVTVTSKKEKITIYTLKDGKTVSATKAIDAGDMLSVKTLDGKFQSIFKEDIVKEESKEQ